MNKKFSIYLPLDSEFLKVNDKYTFDFEEAFNFTQQYRDKMTDKIKKTYNREGRIIMIAKMEAVQIVEFLCH